MATLSFSTHFPKRMGGKETNFVGKIWQSLFNKIVPESDIDKFLYSANGYQANIFDFCKGQHAPKLHTIRTDEKDRWKVGDKIHMVVFNRTKNRFQFAPVLEVKGIQNIKIAYMDEFMGSPIVIIDNVVQEKKAVKTLALNDGFESVEQFFKWFNEDFTGKIIHWTELKY